MDLVYFFRVLLKRKWIIIGSSFLAGLIAWFLTRDEPLGFRSSSRISTGFAVPDEIKISDNNLSIFDAELRFNNAINTWTSQSVISLLSYDLILHDLKNPSAFRAPNVSPKQSGAYVNIADAKKIFEDKLETMSILSSYKPEERKLLEYLNLYHYDYKSLSQVINIYQVPRTDYIQIDCVTENPELSAFIVNNLFTQFIRYYKSVRSSKSQESLDTLRSIMEKKKDDLDAKNKLLRGEGTVDAVTENTSKLSLISDLEKTLTDEKNHQTEDYYMLRKLNQRIANLAGANPSTTTTPTAPSSSNNNEELIIARKAMNDAYTEYLRTEDRAMLNKYNQLKAEYNSKYANSVQATEKVTDNSKANQQETMKNDLAEKKENVEVDLEASNAKIESLQAKINSLKGNVSSLSVKGMTVETLMEEVKMVEKDYFDAKQRYNNALDMGSSSVNNFKQIQIAQPAIEAEPSKRMMLVGMAGAITFCTGILIIFLLTYLDSSIKTPVIFAKKVNLRLLSMVNFMNLKNKNLKDIVTGQGFEESKIEKKRLNVFRESIRKLRYEIEHTGKKIFLFTSTKKGEGKTTLIQALAYSMSLSKKRILIIDTNFCNNDLTVQLGGSPVLEKISAEQSGKQLAAQIESFSKDVGAETVFILGSEGGEYTPSEILPHENVLNHLQAISADFDFIFLEGPPLNDFSDSRELLEYVDGVVAIFSASHIIKQIDKESIGLFKELNGKFCGSVLNMVDLENVNTI